MKRVGIIGPADRDEVRRLAMRLEERAAEPVVLDSRHPPRIRLGPGREEACGVDLSPLSAFYVADLGLPSPTVKRADGRVDEEASARALGASRRHLSAWNALLSRLEQRCAVVNPPRTHDLHALKPWEMATYWNRDVAIPLTKTTSDPAELLRLAESGVDEWIVKGLVGGYGYTEVFEPPATMEEAQERLARGPVQVQERIQGDNIRAFVLEGEVIGAASIVPLPGAETDSRRGDKHVRRVTPSERMTQTAIAAASQWDMPFAAVDLMHDERRDRDVVLECNSAPFFVAFERVTGCDVSGRLADTLVGRGRSTP